MDRIESFQVDHLKLLPGVYVSVASRLGNIFDGADLLHNCRQGKTG